MRRWNWKLCISGLVFLLFLFFVYQVSHRKEEKILPSGEYTAADGVIWVGTPEGTIKYCGYNQENYGAYYAQYGCVTTAVSIAASAFGKLYSPEQIHTAAVTEPYGELYALYRHDASDALYGKAALSVTAASWILDGIGIENRPVCSFARTAAVRQITEHLRQGKPVIVKVNNREVNHIRLANGHHALVLIGIDQDENVVFVNPVGSRVNYAHGSGNDCKIQIETLVEEHMEFENSDPDSPYVTDIRRAGGYILVG